MIKFNVVCSKFAFEVTTFAVILKLNWRINPAAINPVNIAVTRQTFFKRRVTNFLGSTTLKTGSNYQISWKHLPENQVATTFFGNIRDQILW